MSIKLNLHSHSRHSDGRDTIMDMAKAYKKHDFTCAVITDHHYDGDPYFSMNKAGFLKSREEAKEAEELLKIPVIIGIEFGFFRCEEVLCFGKEFILRLYDGVKSVKEFIELRREYSSACIVCHPQLREGEMSFIHMGGEDAVDGYEHFNRGVDFFSFREIPPEMKRLTAFSNSDAHKIENLNSGYNLIKDPIKSEEDLISFINHKKPIELVCKGRK